MGYSFYNEENCTPPTACKEYLCTSYEDAMMNVLVPTSYWPFTDGLAGTSGDLSYGARIYDKIGSNDLFVDNSAGTYFFTDPILPDDCEGSQCLGINAGSGTALRMSQDYLPRPTMAATGEGIFGGVAYKTGGSPNGSIGSYEWSISSTGTTGGQISVSTWDGNTIGLSMQTNEFNDAGGYVTVHQQTVYIAVPSFATNKVNLQVTWKTTGLGSTATTTARVYTNWDRTVEHGSLTLTGELNTVNLPYGSEISQCSFYQRLNHTFVDTTIPADTIWDQMEDAWNQNFVGYVDPDPECGAIVPVWAPECTPPSACKEYACDALLTELIAQFDNVWIGNDPTGSSTLAPSKGSAALDAFGSPQLEQAALLDDNCGETSTRIEPGIHWRNASASFITSLSGSFGGIVQRVTTNSLRLMEVEPYGPNICSVGLAQSGTNIDVAINPNGVNEVIETYVDAYPSSSTHHFLVNYTLTETGDYTVELFRDFVSLGVRTGSPGGVMVITTPRILFGGAGTTGVSLIQYMSYANSIMSSEQIALLKDALDRNSTTYVDPDPNCGSVELVWAPLCENPVDGWVVDCTPPTACKEYSCTSLADAAPGLDFFPCDDPTYSSTIIEPIRKRGTNAGDMWFWNADWNGTPWASPSTIDLRAIDTGTFQLCEPSTGWEGNDNYWGLQWDALDLSPTVHDPAVDYDIHSLYISAVVSNIQDGISTTIGETGYTRRLRKSDGNWDSYSRGISIRIHHDGSNWVIQFAFAQVEFKHIIPAGYIPTDSTPRMLQIRCYTNPQYNKGGGGIPGVSRRQYNVWEYYTVDCRIDDHIFPQMTGYKWQDNHYSEALGWGGDNPDSGFEMIGSKNVTYFWEYKGFAHSVFMGKQTDTDMDEIYDAFLRNFSDYVDPDPNCSVTVTWEPPCENPVTGWTPNYPCFVPADPVLLYASAVAQQGYGQDRLISVGATSTEFMINPIGWGPLQYTADGGQTWTPIDFSSNTGLRICQDMNYVNGVWWILGYRSDANRADRSWYKVGTPDGTWTFTNDQVQSYNHGVHYEGSDTFWRYDGNNNGPGVMRKYADQFGTPVTYESAVNPVPGQKNAWNTRRVGNDLLVLFEEDGTKDNYMVWDISANIPVFVDSFSDVVGDVYHWVTDGSKVQSVTRASQGGITGGNGVTVSAFHRTGPGLTQTVTCPAAVDYPSLHYDGTQWITMAVDTVDPTKLYYLRGTSGATEGEIILPIAAGNDYERELRYIGNRQYLLAYHADIGTTDRALHVVRIEL